MDTLISVEPTAKEVNSPWPQEVRELGYQFYSFVCGRNAAKTAAMLAERGHAVPERTVQHWASADGWAQRAHADLTRIAPDIRHSTIAELIYAGLEAARGLRAVVNDQLPQEIQNELARLEEAAKDENLDERAFNKMVDATYARADRLMNTRVKAYLGTLDRAGFSPVGSNAPELPKISVAEEAKKLRDMTPQERVEEQRRLLDSQRGLVSGRPTKRGK